MRTKRKEDSTWRRMIRRQNTLLHSFVRLHLYQIRLPNQSLFETAKIRILQKGDSKKKKLKKRRVNRRIKVKTSEVLTCFEETNTKNARMHLRTFGTGKFTFIYMCKLCYVWVVHPWKRSASSLESPPTWHIVAPWQTWRTMYWKISILLLSNLAMCLAWLSHWAIVKQRRGRQR